MNKKIKNLYCRIKDKFMQSSLSKLGMTMFVYIGLICLAIVRIIFEFDFIHIFLLIYMVFYVVQYILVKLR
jgi:hypothetical protein